MSREKKFNFFICFNETEVQVVFDQICIFPVAAFFQRFHSYVPFFPRLCFTKKRTSSLFNLPLQARLSSWFLCQITSVYIPTLSIPLVPISLYMGLFMSDVLISPGRTNTDSRRVVPLTNTASPFVQLTQRRPASPARDTIHLLAAGMHCGLQCTPCPWTCSAGDVHAAASVLAI